MKSIRTQYREKKLEILTDCIKDVTKLILLEKRIIEKVHMYYFKKLKKDLEEIKKRVNDIQKLSYN